MRQAFPPPVSLRGNETAQQAALDVYRKALQRFPREVLAEAYQMAAERQTYHCWPKCAVILAVAKALMPEQEPVEWVEKAVELAHTYTERFMKTSAAAEKAREGGYEPRLKRYVRKPRISRASYTSRVQNRRSATQRPSRALQESRRFQPAGCCKFILG